MQESDCQKFNNRVKFNAFRYGNTKQKNSTSPARKPVSGMFPVIIRANTASFATATIIIISVSFLFIPLPTSAPALPSIISVPIISLIPSD